MKTALDMAIEILRLFRETDTEGWDLHSFFELIAGDDPAVYELLQRGDTVGVFQIESRAQIAMLPRTRPVLRRHDHRPRLGGGQP